MTRKRFMKILRAVYTPEISIRNLAQCVNDCGDSYAFALELLFPYIEDNYKALGIPLPRELRKGRERA